MKRFLHAQAVHPITKKDSKSDRQPEETHRLLIAPVSSSKQWHRLYSTPSDLLPHLQENERRFFQLVMAGDISSLSSFLEEQQDFNINCQNYQGYTALVTAIHNVDKDMTLYLLQFDSILLDDALLHAVQTKNVEIVKLILERQRKSALKLNCAWESAHFSPDITPLMLAAHQQSYEIVRCLLNYGYKLDKPHPPSCFCYKKCRNRKFGESLAESRARYNTYKALTNPAYMCQTAADPILECFQLSEELRQLSEMEREFKSEYLELATLCCQFAVDLLEQCRTTDEVKELLHKQHGEDSTYQGPKYSRLSYALDSDQKSFVAHPNCQQVLRTAWLEGWQDWKSLGFFTKLSRLIPRIILLPLMALVYWIIPKSYFVQSWKCPLNKFFNYAASYLIFLTVLLWQNALDSERSQRGPPTTGFEWGILLYIIGLFWRNMKTLRKGGFRIYRKESWNLYDFTMVILFFASFSCWGWSAYDVYMYDNRYLPRQYWDQFDPTLVGEAFYATAIIFAFGKLMFFFQIGNYIGPLQVSMGRMLKDIGNFLVVFMLMIVAFAVGLHKLYHHYEGQIRSVEGDEAEQSKAFSSIILAFHTLYWSIYGYSPPAFADVITAEHHIRVGNETRMVVNDHHFTSAVGHTMFALYYIVGVIVMINMLIAMLSTSFSNVQANADTEWKFSRTQIWVSFFSEGSTLPPPFNLVPTPKSFYQGIRWLVKAVSRDGTTRWNFKRCCHYEDEVTDEADEANYQVLMGNLVQRYLTSNKHSEIFTTELPLRESLQSELREILNNTRAATASGQWLQVESDGSRSSRSSDSLPSTRF